MFPDENKREYHPETLFSQVNSKRNVEMNFFNDVRLEQDKIFLSNEKTQDKMQVFNNLHDEDTEMFLFPNKTQPVPLKQQRGFTNKTMLLDKDYSTYSSRNSDDKIVKNFLTFSNHNLKPQTIKKKKEYLQEPKHKSNPHQPYSSSLTRREKFFPQTNLGHMKNHQEKFGTTQVKTSPNCQILKQISAASQKNPTGQNRNPSKSVVKLKKNYPSYLGQKSFRQARAENLRKIINPQKELYSQIKPKKCRMRKKNDFNIKILIKKNKISKFINKSKGDDVTLQSQPLSQKENSDVISILSTLTPKRKKYQAMKSDPQRKKKYIYKVFENWDTRKQKIFTSAKGKNSKSSFKLSIKKMKNNNKYKYKSKIMKVKRRIYEQYNRNYLAFAHPELLKQQGHYVNPRNRRIGGLTYQERQQKIQKYLMKRKRRQWQKPVGYHVRQKVAENRLRVKGRFVTKEQAVKLLTEHSREKLELLDKGQLQKLLKQKFKKKKENLDDSMETQGETPQKTLKRKKVRGAEKNLLAAQAQAAIVKS